MKLISCLFTSAKIVALAAAVICVAPALAEDFSTRSILEQARQEIFGIELSRSHDFSSGAVTFDNFYSFDYANAGIGTVIFRKSLKRFEPLVIDQDAVRAVSGWGSSSESSPFLSPSFASNVTFFVDQSSVVSSKSPDSVSPDEIPLIPEPSTWLAGALALAALAFARRRSLRGLIARAT